MKLWSIPLMALFSAACAHTDRTVSLKNPSTGEIVECGVVTAGMQSAWTEGCVSAYRNAGYVLLGRD